MRTLESLLDTEIGINDQDVAISAFADAMGVDVYASKVAVWIQSGFDGKMKQPLTPDIFKHIKQVIFDNKSSNTWEMPKMIGGVTMPLQISQVAYPFITLISNTFENLTIRISEQLGGNMTTLEICGVGGNISVKRVLTDTKFVKLNCGFNPAIFKELKGEYENIKWVAPDKDSEFIKFVEQDWSKVNVSRMLGGKRCNSISINSGRKILYISHDNRNSTDTEKYLITKDGWQVSLVETRSANSPAHMVVPVRGRFVLD